jgi:plastocyanin
MRILSLATRRQFGLLMGAGLVGPLAPKPLLGHDGPHRLEVEISKFRFTPATLTLRQGDSVVWTNRDIAPHSATHTDGDWDTGAIPKDGSAEISFDAVGKFAYFCVFHPAMKAEITVESQ